MRIHADFTRAVAVTPDSHQWVPSPQPGVARVMLDRIGHERARATSLVRYDAHSRFPAHAHPGGEEILVLDGVFSDAEQAYPAGWYIRNPPNSAHQPFSDGGARLFVKLWQMRADEFAPVRVDTRNPANWRNQGDQLRCDLFDDGHECTRIERLGAGQSLTLDATGGVELLVLQGALSNGHLRLPLGSWLRAPADAWPGLVATERTTVFVKTGHLPTPEQIDQFERGLQTS